MVKVNNVFDSIIIIQNLARFLGFSGTMVNKSYEIVGSLKEFLFSLLSTAVMVYVIYNLKSNHVRVSIASGSTFFDNGIQWISVLEMTSVLIVKYSYFFLRQKNWNIFQRIHNVDAIVSFFSLKILLIICVEKFFFLLSFNSLNKTACKSTIRSISKCSFLIIICHCFLLLQCS